MPLYIATTLLALAAACATTAGLPAPADLAEVSAAQVVVCP
jgi:hypothetical protein